MGKNEIPSGNSPSAPPPEAISVKSPSPVNAQSPSSPTKQSDDDTEIEEAPIATPLTTVNENSDGPEVAVAAADVPPGETEIDLLPKAAPVPLAHNAIETRDIIETPSTSPMGTQNDADAVKTPAPQPTGPAVIKKETHTVGVNEWDTDLGN